MDPGWRLSTFAQLIQLILKVIEKLCSAREAY
jgi:hypothetical protein